MIILYIIGIGCDEYQKQIIREDGMPSHQLAFCINGSGKFCIDNREYLIDKGKAFFFRPNTAHQYYPVNEPWTTLWIVFSGIVADSLLDVMNYKKFEIISDINPEESLIWYNRLISTIRLKDNNYMPEASAILYNLLINTGRLLSSRHTDNNTGITSKLDKVIKYIRENYHKDISLNDMASTVGVSPSYLCRIFKKEYKLSPIAYLIRYRINIAKEALINKPDMNIRDIAYETGFSDNSYFGVIFREFEGCSPKQFRMLYSR